MQAENYTCIFYKHIKSGLNKEVGQLGLPLKSWNSYICETVVKLGPTLNFAERYGGMMGLYWDSIKQLKGVVAERKSSSIKATHTRTNKWSLTIDIQAEWSIQEAVLLANPTSWLPEIHINLADR